MLKLIIAEDETLAREAIERSMDFAAYGFELVASCEDGLEAWEAVKREDADMLLTDINMPGMSGLELAKAIYEEKRDCRVVIITGYDRFDYARQAISYQVADYLLKPVTPGELREILAKHGRLLGEQIQRREQIEEQISHALRTENLAKNQLLNRFVSGNLDPANPDVADEGLRRLFAQPCYLIGLLSQASSRQKLQELKLSAQEVHYLLFNLAEELAREVPELIVFPSVDSPIVLLFGGVQERALEKRLRQFVEHLEETFRRLTSLTFRTGYSSAEGAAQLARAKEEADIALRFARRAGQASCVSFHETRRLSQQDLDRCRGLLLQALEGEGTGDIPTLVSEYVSALSFVQLRAEERARDFALLCEGAEARACPLSPAFIAAPTQFDQLGGGDALPFRDALLAQITQALGRRDSERAGGPKTIVQNAKRYIEQHFADKELSLIALCTRLNVSMSYFSSLFKSETGQTFVEYLTETRMKNAKRLLVQSNLMLYTIADRTGYESAAYFTAAFKKHSGCTPKEFRKRFRIEEEG